MSWAFARCSCGDVIERYAEHWQHLAMAGQGRMIQTKLGDLEHQAMYELVEHRIYVRPKEAIVRRDLPIPNDDQIPH
jgi:hypothetical protein